MRQALALARRGLGATHPNPAVGCVIVSRDGEVCWWWGWWCCFCCGVRLTVLNDAAA
jgi:hypothetical protein